MNIQTLNQTIKTLEGLRNAVGSFTRAEVDLTLGLLRREQEALAEQPAQRQARSADTWVHATEWRGLTDEEIETIYANCNMWDKFEYERMLEAKLKAKNSP